MAQQRESRSLELIGARCRILPDESPAKKGLAPQYEGDSRLSALEAIKTTIAYFIRKLQRKIGWSLIFLLHRVIVLRVPELNNGVDLGRTRRSLASLLARVGTLRLPDAISTPLLHKVPAF